MALKDWKLVFNVKDQVLYKHKDGERIIIITDEGKRKKWLFSVNLGNRREFKTKSQAMKFARSYMRRN